MRYHPLAAPVWGPKYSPADIALALGVRAYLEQTRTSAIIFADRAGCSAAMVREVLKGAYDSKPSNLLARMSASEVDQAETWTSVPRKNQALREPVWGAQYTDADINLALAVRAWMASTATSIKDLALRISASYSNLSTVLSGSYPNSPKKYLARCAEAAGIAVAPPEPLPAPAVTRDLAHPVIKHRVSSAREGILKVFAKHRSREQLSVDDLVALVGGDEREVWGALEKLIAERAVMSATVTRMGISSQVVYLMGRVPVSKPAGRPVSKPITAAPLRRFSSMEAGC